MNKKPEPPDSGGHDEPSRVRLGASAHTPAELLQSLAADASVTVRAALAMNPAAPPDANRTLAQDPDERVRALLANKLANLMPNLPNEDQLSLQNQAIQTLMGMVADEAVRVRSAIAEAVKEMPEAPRALVLRLAHDEAVMVSEPVIRLSPLLTTQDLLALLAKSPPMESVVAVSHRKGIDAAVSDAIAATANSAAIRALLMNHSAQIREATLDALIARSVDHADWHEPLVRRPALSARAARALSEIVATHLLERLAARGDLEPALASELRARIADRLAGAAATPAPNDTRGGDALATARDMAARGCLTEAALMNAARQGDSRLVAALLATAAGVSVSVVDRAASLRSAKGLVSLAWKAGFTMRCAPVLQSMLARLAPNATIPAGPGGSFPLAVEEMRWQLDFLNRMGR